MSEIHKYVMVDANDQEQDVEYDDFVEAVVNARHRGFAVIERVYELSDSGLLWTPDGSDTWPPQADGNEKGDNE